MAHDYNPKTKQFTGITRQQRRAEIDSLTSYVSKQAQRIGAKYAKASINLAEFEIEMRELLKSSHLIAASVGRGGWARMTASDWGTVGSRLRKEYGYLAAFVRKIGSGQVSKVATPHRAKLYADSVRMSFHKTVHKEETLNSVTPIRARLVQNSAEGCSECNDDAARGWVAVEDLDEIGTRICESFCRCDILFSDDVQE